MIPIAIAYVDGCNLLKMCVYVFFFNFIFIFDLQMCCLKIRYTPSEGKHDSEHEVESTYKILLPSSIQNYQLPRFHPVTGSLHLPIRQVYADSGLSIVPFRSHLNIPFYPIHPVIFLWTEFIFCHYLFNVGV